MKGERQGCRRPVVIVRSLCNAVSLRSPHGTVVPCDKEVALAILPIPFPVNQNQYPTEILWKLAPSTTVGLALNSATQRLKEAQIEGAWLDAQVILAATLGVDRSWLFAHGEFELTAKQADALTDLITRRIRHLSACRQARAGAPSRDRDAGR